MNPAEPQSTATYTVDHTVQVGDADDHEAIGGLAYNFTEADTGAVTLVDVTVEIDGTEVEVESVDADGSAVTIEIDPYEYGQNDADHHDVTVTIDNVENPDAGDYVVYGEVMDESDTGILEEVATTTYSIGDGESTAADEDDDPSEDESAGDAESAGAEETAADDATAEDDDPADDDESAADNETAADDESADDAANAAEQATEDPEIPEANDMGGFGAAIAFLAVITVGLWAALRDAH